MQIIYDLSQIDSIASQIISYAKSNIILFYGDMGVGKTTLIKAIALKLGVKEVASSPTFSIVNEYNTDKEECIYHFDFYRITDADEALDLGFEEYIAQGDWIFIEWPDKIAKYLPTDAQKVLIELTNDKQRKITLH